MRVLVIGSGGREHALAWKLKQSPALSALFIAPGNAGTDFEGQNVPVDAADIEGIVRFVRSNRVDLVIPGPEQPLMLGLKDRLAEIGAPCFGPDAYAAQLEGSKSFAKDVMRAAGTPTARFEVFTDIEKARDCVREWGAPVVVKADGLAAGKGVVVAKTEEEALDALERMMVRREFGDAGKTVVIEEALCGEEVSFLALCQDDTVIPLPSAQDHKAVFDNDEGPNTGGMGAYSPAPVLPDARAATLVDELIRPVLRELKKRGHPFTGILYAGLMMTKDGPKVLEFNVRFGDPECQALLMRLDGDILPLMHAAATGRLAETSLSVKPEASLCVVLAAKGYPNSRYAKGMHIQGIEEAEALGAEQGGEVKVFLAGVSQNHGTLVASGGRVLSVTALGRDIAHARKLAYAALERIRMPMGHWRADIGMKGLNR